MAPRSRRIKEDPTEQRCRRCLKVKPSGDFYSAVDLEIDRSGKMSVCNQCCNELYDDFYVMEHSQEKALLKLCRMLNIKYDETALTSTRTHLHTMAENGKLNVPFFGIYKSKLHNSTGNQAGDRGEVDLTYQDVTQINVISENPLNEDEFEGAEDIIQFWGTDDKGDLEFLERELANFKKSHKNTTYAELILLKEVCQTLLEISKARKAAKSTDSLVKSLQNIMKTSAIAPYMESEAGSDKSMDSFGMWVKDIENTTPAEWVKDKDIYKDVDNLQEYIDRYIISPLRNFITGSRDFKMDSSVDDSELDDIEEAVASEE